MNNSYQNTIGNRWRGYFLSAYGIAVKHGFIGNEEDWLLSLTAYGIALKLGFEGTQEEWIASLKGEKGDPFKYEDFTPEQLEALKNEIAGAFFAEAEALKESAEEAASNAEKSKEAAEEAASNAEKSKEAAEAAAAEAINICKSSLYDGKKVSGNTINIPNEAFSYAKILSIEGLSHIENKTLIPSGLYVENNGDLFSIPEQIISLENYGHGAGEGYNNTIDFERGIYTERCSLFVPEKAINYNEYLTYFLNLGFDIPMERYDEYIKAIETIKCSHSELTFEYWEVVQDENGMISSGALGVKLNGIVPSEEELQEFIDNQRAAGTPVVVCHGLPDPVVTDISDIVPIIDITVTPGGVVSFDGATGTLTLFVLKELTEKKYTDSTFAPALRGKLSGTIVGANDVSPIGHELDIKLTGENVEGTVVKQYGKNILENHNAVGSIVSYPHLASAKGVSFERLSDGGIHVISTGENTSGVGYYFDSYGNYVANKLRDGVDYIVSPYNPVGKLYFYISYKDENGVMKYRDRVKWSDKYSNASFYFQVNAGATVDTIVYPMLEIGATATEFEPFREPTTAVADADGNVSGLMSLAPSMTLITDNESAVIECAYNRDTNKVIEELTNAIISLGGNI